MAKPNVNYWTDAGIGAAFMVSAVSGLVFLLPVGGEDAGGILGLTYRVWDQVHLWSSVAMIAGVLAHLVLHTKWVVAMTKKVFCRVRRKRTGEPCPAPHAAQPIPRRRFLTLSGITLAAGAVLATCGAVVSVLTRIEEVEGEAVDAVLSDGGQAQGSARILEAAADDWDKSASGKVAATIEPTETADPVVVEPTPTPVAQEAEPLPDPTATPAAPVRTCVDCPRGLVNDPYPGRCRLYIDRDGDRICDRSVPYVCG
jgi:hypothetical protein